MVHALSVGAIIDRFLSPTLLKQPGKPDHASIREIHGLLTSNAGSTKSPHGGGQNGHLGHILMTTQYALVVQVPFVRLTNPSQTFIILAWTYPFVEKRLIREHVGQLRQYNKCRNINSALCNQLLTAFEDICLSPLKHVFTG